MCTDREDIHVEAGEAVVPALRLVVTDDEVRIPNYCARVSANVYARSLMDDGGGANVHARSLIDVSGGAYRTKRCRRQPHASRGGSFRCRSSRRDRRKPLLPYAS